MKIKLITYLDCGMERIEIFLEKKGIFSSEYSVTFEKSLGEIKTWPKSDIKELTVQEIDTSNNTIRVISYDK